MSTTVHLRLAKWSDAPRVRALNRQSISPAGRYVLCWLQQAPRANDNPVFDAAILVGNELGLPVLVYHGLREDYPYASDRLHRFILGASRTDRSIRQRPDGPEWIAKSAGRTGPRLGVPVEPVTDPYLSERVPI